jgi:hypothetical protein
MEKSKEDYPQFTSANIQGFEITPGMAKRKFVGKKLQPLDIQNANK